MTLADRIKARMAQLNLSQAEVARRVGVAQPTIAKLVAGTSRSSSHLHRIARALETTPAYLAGETEDPAEGAQPLPTLESIIETFGQVMVPMIDLARDTKDDEVEAKPRFISFDKTRLESMVREEGLTTLLACDVRGDAMFPTLVDGDVCLIDCNLSEVREQDRLWAIDMAGAGMIKRVRVNVDGTLSLMSDNPMVTPINVKPSQITILGRLIWRSGVL